MSAPSTVKEHCAPGHRLLLGSRPCHGATSSGLGLVVVSLGGHRVLAFTKAGRAELLERHQPPPCADLSGSAPGSSPPVY